MATNCYIGLAVASGTTTCPGTNSPRTPKTFRGQSFCPANTPVLGGVFGNTGRNIFRFPDGNYVPVSGNGRLLLMHGFSRLYAVEPRRR